MPLFMAQRCSYQVPKQVCDKQVITFRTGSAAVNGLGYRKIFKRQRLLAEHKIAFVHHQGTSW